MPDKGIEARDLLAASNSVGRSVVKFRDVTIVGGRSGRRARCPGGGNEGESTIIEGNDVEGPDTVEADTNRDSAITGVYLPCVLNWLGLAPGVVQDGESMIAGEASKGKDNVSCNAFMPCRSLCFLSTPPGSACESFDEESEGIGEVEISEWVGAESLPDWERSALNLEVLGRLRGGSERCCSPCC